MGSPHCRRAARGGGRIRAGRLAGGLPVGLYVVVLVGIASAATFAYLNSGLLVSWVLVLAPVAGALAVSGAFACVRSARCVVALPGSFKGTGAVEFWVPFALLVGTLAFCLGVAVRRFASALGRRGLRTGAGHESEHR